MKTIKNMGDLRIMLLETIADVRSGKIEAEAAAAVARLTGHIISSANLDLSYLRYSEGKARKRIASIPSGIAIK